MGGGRFVLSRRYKFKGVAEGTTTLEWYGITRWTFVGRGRVEKQKMEQAERPPCRLGSAPMVAILESVSALVFVASFYFGSHRACSPSAWHTVYTMILLVSYLVDTVSLIWSSLFLFTWLLYPTMMLV